MHSTFGRSRAIGMFALESSMPRAKRSEHSTFGRSRAISMFALETRMPRAKQSVLSTFGSSRAIGKQALESRMPRAKLSALSTLLSSHATGKQAHETNKAGVKRFSARNTKCTFIYTLCFLVLIDKFFLMSELCTIGTTWFSHDLK